MAVVYISEFSTLAQFPNQGPQMAAWPPIAEQTVAIGVEAKSQPFGATTRFIRIHTDSACSIMIGANPTATTAKLRMAGNQTEYCGVNPGDRLSVISNT
jgi:hypothetical protein